MRQCKLHEREKKAFIHAGPLWLLHGIGTNNGGYHVAIMANAPLTSHVLKTSEPQQWIPLAEVSLWPCLVPNFFLKFYYINRRFFVTSKYRHMYEVLNVDEI
jgi:hypothetical protein